MNSHAYKIDSKGENAVAFLGPEGTYCDEAAHRFAQRLGLIDARFVPCPSFGRIFDMVEDGACEYGVVALENSIEGPVTATLDSFAQRENFVILGEEIVDVRHCLLLNQEATLEGVKRIASHPQALAQCRGYIDAHFANIPTQSAQSTADAARMAAADPTVAAIANEHAAQLSGTRIVARDIANHGGDQTDFALIAQNGHEQVFPATKAMKTSLALFLHDDRPGALQMILSEFAYGGINLTKIQSRPTKRRLGEYMFFIDIDGSIEEERVRIALDCLRIKLRKVKVLGCFPRAQQ